MGFAGVAPRNWKYPVSQLWSQLLKIAVVILNSLTQGPGVQNFIMPVGGVGLKNDLKNPVCKPSAEFGISPMRARFD